MPTLSRRDVQALRRVIRYVSTSNPDIQHEALRLDAVLEKALTDPPKEPTNGT